MPHLTYPIFDPVALQIGPLEIRWYALAYIAAILIGWFYAARALKNEKLWAQGQARPTVQHFDDVIVYITLGVVLGGRLAYVLFYDPARFMQEPWEIPAIWHGGMSYHGGFLGAMLAIILFAKAKKIPALTMLDVAAAAAPLGSLFGRIANFIKPELWGRPSDVYWAMVFPGAGNQPRHPSQLYQAALEGLLLFIILQIIVKRGGFKRPGLVAGCYGTGYGIARIIGELFREPDPQLGFIFGGVATMGMLLSLPMILAGGWLIVRAYRKA
jgi:phosphatidylglycerol---prolipoprotein diacylglyceryl transferase